MAHRHGTHQLEVPVAIFERKIYEPFKYQKFGKMSHRYGIAPPNDHYSVSRSDDLVRQSESYASYNLAS